MERSAITKESFFIGDCGKMLFAICAVYCRKSHDSDAHHAWLKKKQIPEVIPAVVVRVFSIDKDGILNYRELELGKVIERYYTTPEDDAIQDALALLQKYEARLASNKELETFFREAKQAAKKYHESKLNELVMKEKEEYTRLQGQIDAVEKGDFTMGPYETIYNWFEYLPTLQDQESPYFRVRYGEMF